MKKIILMMPVILLAANTYAQSNIFEDGGNVGIGIKNPTSKLHVDGITTTNAVSLANGVSTSGYIGRGLTITEAWAQLPNALTLTYQSNDFAIGGWSKSTNKWMGPSFFINSDNGNVGIGTTTPATKLQVDGVTTTVLMTLAQGTSEVGYLGRGLAITGGWSQAPDAFTLTYQSRDFAIGGWSKTAKQWMGPAFFINSDNSNVGIGTVNPDARLTVAGNINAREIKVAVDAGADFVFQDAYKLPPLTEVGAFIKTHKHLPEIASAETMKKDGLDLGEINIKLLQKVEELTLYLLEMKDQIELVQQENLKLKEAVSSLQVLKKQN